MGNNTSGQICIDNDCYKCDGTFKYKNGQPFCNDKQISPIVSPNIIIKIGQEGIEIKNEEKIKNEKKYNL